VKSHKKTKMKEKLNRLKITYLLKRRKKNDLERWFWVKLIIYHPFAIDQEEEKMVCKRVSGDVSLFLTFNTVNIYLYKTNI